MCLSNKQCLAGLAIRVFNILVDLVSETLNLKAVRYNQLTSVSSLVTAIVLLLSCQ